MLKKLLIAMSGALVLATAVTVPAPAKAQSGPENYAPPALTDQTRARNTRTDASRLGRQRERNAAAPVAPDPERVKADAQAVAAAASTNCQVAEANLLGVNTEQQSIYEASCTVGPGFILIASTPPQAVDCVILSGQADLTRQRDPAADVGMQCALPANTNVVGVLANYAKEAGVNCTVDQGASIGKATSGNVIYEVGCTNADGYWLEKTPTGWTKTTCMQVLTQNATCRFTTAAEQASTVKAWLAGSAASACDVTETRYMGSNANGSFYEAKCGAGDGYIARFDTAMAVQQLYPCAEAARIGGGCKLTVVPASAEAAPAPAAAPATEQ